LLSKAKAQPDPQNDSIPALCTANDSIDTHHPTYLQQRNTQRGMAFSDAADDCGIAKQHYVRSLLAKGGEQALVELP